MTIAMLLANTVEAARLRGVSALRKPRPNKSKSVVEWPQPTTEGDLDSSRLRTGEIVAGIGGLALFVFRSSTGSAAGRKGFDRRRSGWDGRLDLVASSSR